MTAAIVCPAKCDEGWVCERHPDRGWPGDGPELECSGPGMPCLHEPCPFWPQGKQRLPVMDGSGRKWVVTR